ncbi:siphovirus Gp157 family protein [Companilactobacillus metriopterae]|uniref:siphovirus Gp157 family protein n=1 Tax=Companilactobacillus metriopterae TaxID=1909267 RepID=UPI00100B912B|nr:siphovirus Gp157 family protein [Companilactobacillus metriopterae]
MSTLYELTDNYMKLLDYAEDMDTTLFHDALDYIDEAIEDKAVNYEKVDKELSKDELALKEYQQVNYNIAVRVVSLEHPWTESDSNTGVGSSGVTIKPQEIFAIKKDEDKELQRLFKLKYDCERAIDKMSDEQLEMYNLRFVNSDCLGCYDIADRLCYSVPGIYKKRYRLLELLAIEKSLISVDKNV